MKKALIALAVAALYLSASSCKRDYYCLCSAKTTKGIDSSIYEGEVHQTKNGALHECCVLKKQGLEEQGFREVSCAVPL